MRERRVLVAGLCAAAAVALGGLAAGFAIGSATSSRLVHMSALDPVAALAVQADPHFTFVPETSHYDGTYFYAVARDPFARGQAHSLIDRPAYRYGHPFYGQLAALLSGGHAAAIPAVLLTISLVSLGVAAGAASLLASGWGWTPWSGLAVALSPGLLYAITADTAECLVAALLGLALLAWRARRLTLAGMLFVLLALTKEPMALVPVGVLAYEVVRGWRRDRTPVPAGWRSEVGRRHAAGALGALAAGPVALVGWLRYVDGVFGVWPLRQSGELLGAPFTGLRDTARTAADYDRFAAAYAQVGAAALPVLLALFAAFAVGIVAALRFRTLADGVYLATAPLMFLLGPLDLLYPKDLLRITVVPVLLLPAVLRGSRRDSRAALTPAGGTAAFP